MRDANAFPAEVPQLRGIYDTHAHYNDNRFDADREEVLQGVLDAGVTLVNEIGTAPESSAQAVTLAEKYPFIWAVVGTWPGYTQDMKEEDLDFYRTLAKNQKVRAIGEIGLDYHYEDDAPRKTQKYWLERQLELADQLGLPVVIHEREAHGDAMEILRRWAGKVPGAFHCFSGSADMAKEIIRWGWNISFTGVLTFKNARRALEAAAAVPISRIFLETDAPYMAPVPWRGRRCDSRYIPYMAEKLAEIKGLSSQEIVDITRENGMRFFRISETESALN